MRATRLLRRPGGQREARLGHGAQPLARPASPVPLRLAPIACCAHVSAARDDSSRLWMSRLGRPGSGGTPRHVPPPSSPEAVPFRAHVSSLGRQSAGLKPII